MKTVHTIVAVVGIALAGGAAWWWQQRPAVSASAGQAAPGGGAAATGGARPAAAVEVARAEAARLTDDVQAVGSLRSRQGVTLRPEVSGRIAQLGFRDGDRVRRGQLLVQLDDTLQRAQLQQAEAQASIARTNLTRSRELLAQNFVSASAVDQNAAALEVAEAQVALARAQLARMRVLAPFDGVTGLKMVEVGDYIKDGADIVNIEDLSSLTVQFALPERYIDRLRPGLAVEVLLDALPGRPFTGRVLAVDSQVDANGRALQVLAQVDNPAALLRPGMFARPRVVFAVREGAVVVPEEALVPVGGQQYLFKIVEGSDGRRVAQRLEAVVGLRLPGRVEILQGLAPGDLVATAGQQRLLTGDQTAVRVVEIGGAAAGAGGSSGTSPGNGAATPPKP